VIHCGVDIDRYRGLGSPLKPSSNDAVLQIVAVGSLNEKKGHEYLIQACDLVRKQGLDFQCDIIGGGSREEALRQLIQQLDLDDYVTLHGALPHEAILEAYGRADIFALACVVAANGDRDGIPVALMEAGIAELAIVSTAVSGIPELVRHEGTGLLVPERDARALADAIVRLSQDPGLRRQLGANAKQLVLAEFSSDGLADQLIEAMGDIVGRPSGRPLRSPETRTAERAWIPPG
jgi:glycosyltransferase involved in cell wall biosynthesis